MLPVAPPALPAAAALGGMPGDHAVSRRQAVAGMAGLAAAMWPGASAQAATTDPRIRSWPLNTPQRTGIHDVAPAPDGGVWLTAQRSGHLGWFNPADGHTELIALGAGSSPHGVIQGPDRAAWITDSGLNAMVRVGWPDRQVRVFPLPAGTPYANLNTAAFDGDGHLWFTGQSGYVGKVELPSGQVSVKESARGRGPYGICATPQGEVWWCSLAGSYIARIDRRSGESRIVEPPTPRQGARRVWSDSAGRIWVAEWLSGNLSMYDPAAQRWQTHRPPGANPRIYAVYVDEKDIVWCTDWGANCLWRFEPGRARFEAMTFEREATNIRQILGRRGEVWLPESGTEFISMVRSG